MCPSSAWVPPDRGNRTTTSFTSTEHVNATAFVLLIHYFTADVSPSPTCLMTHSICVLSGEHLSLLLKDPDQPDGSKALKVAIIGAPNAGKSTLSNQLLGRKVSVACCSSLHIKTNQFNHEGCYHKNDFSFLTGVCRFQKSPHHTDPYFRGPHQ